MKSRHGAIVSDPLNPDVTIAVDQNATLPAFVGVNAIKVLQRDEPPIEMTQEAFIAPNVRGGGAGPTNLNRSACANLPRPRQPTDSSAEVHNRESARLGDAQSARR